LLCRDIPGLQARPEEHPGHNDVVILLPDQTLPTCRQVTTLHSYYLDISFMLKSSIQTSTNTNNKHKATLSRVCKNIAHIFRNLVINLNIQY